MSIIISQKELYQKTTAKHNDDVICNAESEVVLCR